MKRGLLAFLVIVVLLSIKVVHADALENDVKDKYGEEWNVELNENTNSTKRLIGSSIDIKEEKVKEKNELLQYNLYKLKSSTTIDEEVIDNVIKDFVQNNSNFLKVDVAHMKKNRFEYNKPHKKEFESGTWYAFYEQEYNGVSVYNSYLNFIIIDDKIVSISNNFYPDISISVNPTISKEDALNKVKESTNEDDIIVHDVSLMIYPDDSKKPVEYYLAWHVLIDNWKYFIDANNGAILYKETTLRDNTLTGTVTGMVYIPNSKFNQTLVNISLNNITAIHDGSTTLFNVTRNATGFYNISNIAGTLEMVTYLEGPYVKVFNGTTNRANHTFIASSILLNFSNGLKLENLTYDLTKNITRQLNITKNNKIVNAKVTLKGFNSTASYSTNASQASTPLYNFTNIFNNADEFIVKVGQANFSCSNYTFNIYNYSSGRRCNFAQNIAIENCTGGIESKSFSLDNTSCNDFPNFVSDNKVQLNLSGVSNLESIILNYTIVNISSPKNLTIFINNVKTYSNSTFNNISRLSLNTTSLQNTLDSCPENTSENNCLINITFQVSVDGNISKLEYSDLNITHIVATHDFNWNESDNSVKDQETNVFYHINFIHNFFTKGDPFNVSGIDYQIIARTEALSQCNADFSSTTRTIRFGKSNQCTDVIALDSDVIYHEYVHAVVDAIYSVLPYTGQTGAMDEGYADFWAAVSNNNPKIGESSFANGGNDDTCSDCLRNINNTVKKPTSWSEVHSDSRSFSGALWDTRELLGPIEAEPLIMRSMKAQPHSFSEMLDNILLFNDNNGNIADGTPNSSLICRAFTTNHNIQSPFCNSSLGSFQINDSIGSKFFDVVTNGRIVNSSESTDGVEGMADDDITIPIDVGFNFTFFNVNYSQIYIGSDGIVFFENYTIDFFNDFPDVIPIADFSTPNNFISIYRHDLNPGTSNNGGGNVYYWRDSNNNRFLVEWFQVRPFGLTNNQTFELILYKDGRIIFQYLNVTDNTVTNVTVGIENSGGTFGINYINASNIDNLEPFGICFLPVGSSVNCTNAPSITNVTVSSSDVLNRTNATLQGIFSSSDIDGDRISNETVWYKNNIEVTQLRNLTSISPQNTTKDDNWTFSVRTFDGTYFSNFVNASIVIKNAAPIININASLIELNEVQSVNISFSASDIDEDALNYTINDSRFFREGNYFIWNTNLNDAGFYKVNVTVNDSIDIDSFLINITIIDAKDIDNDGNPDFNDNDDDNDGIDDAVDYFIGNTSTINTTVENLSILIGNSTNLSQIFNGTLAINFTQNNITVFSFDFNFSKGIDNVTGTILEKNSKSFIVNGKDYLVTANFISNSRAQLIVNSESTGLLNVGNSYTLSDGATIGVTGITYQDFAGGIHSVDVYVTSQTSRTLDLSKLTINRTTSGSSAVSLRGLLSLLNFTKTAFLEKINTTAKAVCIKDRDASFETISSACNSVGETLVICDNVTSGRYTCFDLGTRYKVIGLNHSAVKEQCKDVDGDGYGTGCSLGNDACDDNPSQHTSSGCNPSSSGSSGGSSGGGGGGGGGGGSGGGGGAFFVCNMDWKCSDWTACVDGLQTKQCEFVKVPQHASDTPCPSQSEQPVTSQKCETPKIALAAETCEDGIKNQDEQDIDCGGVCKPCEEQKNLTAEIKKEESITPTGFAILNVVKERLSTIVVVISISVIVAIIGFIGFNFYKRKI